MASVETTYPESITRGTLLNRTMPQATMFGLSEMEETLLARLRKGEPAAFDELVNKHHGALIRMAMGYVADRESAEEVVQDTWIAVIQGLNRFEGRSSLRTWVFGILIHKAKDRGMRDKRSTTFSDFQSFAEDSEDAIDPSRFQQSGDRAGRWTFPHSLGTTRRLKNCSPVGRRSTR